MEQGPTWNTINFVFGSANISGPRIPYPSGARVPVNTTAFTLRLNIAQCPSDGRDALTVPVGHCNYSGCAGLMPIGAQTTGCDGLFCKVEGCLDPVLVAAGCGTPAGNVVKFADVTDGTSNTAAFSERIKGVGSQNGDVIDSTKPSTTYYLIQSPTGGSGTPGTGGWAQAAETMYAACLASKTVYLGTSTPASGVIPLSMVSMGQYWWFGRMYSGRYNHVMPPNARFCTTGGINYGEQAFGPSSYHPGGVTMAFGDGSVKFIKDSVSRSVFRALGTRNGGEVISADTY
jgi:prepilin-type processing-associated H-X9-DG protein